MRPFDDLIKIDGEHTVWASSGAVEIVPAAPIYTWSDEPAPAWPSSDGPTIREHQPPPMLDPNVAANRRWNASDYEAAVFSQLEHVFGTRCGTRLHRVLSMVVTIMPFPIRDPVNLDGNYRPNAAPRARGSDRSLYIIYTPGHFLPRFRASSLFHELVHVYRIMARMYSPREEARDPQRYTMWEEFPAVCIENIFRSEIGLPLRWGHYDLTRVLNNGTTWLDSGHNRRAVERLIREMPTLTRSLAELALPFNPFRQLYLDRQELAGPGSHAAPRVTRSFRRG